MQSIEEIIILDCYKKQPKDAEALNTIKRQFLRTFKGAGAPTGARLLTAYHKLLKKNKIKQNERLEKILQKRAVRTLSGVAIVTVLTKPFPCPGKCIYCPSEERMPKSYLADEPAAARALALKFDPFQQVKMRLEALATNGHPTDKIELIVKGGSWNAYPLDYQYWFILRCFEACNQTKRLPIAFERVMHQQAHPLADAGQKSEKAIGSLLIKAQQKNETAKHRIVGLTLETRPDCINDQTVNIMRELGCTRIELGVQHTDDKILKLVQRGHDIKETIKASCLLKQYGYKLDYHLMPQLPGSTPKKDAQMLTEIFANQNFRPDMIKIYPCTVVKNSELFDWVKNKKFKPYADKYLIKILKEFKERIPRYVRISRLIRDIPSHHIVAGNRITNLRQIIQAQMKKENTTCRCLRCREIGHQDLAKLKKEKTKLFIERYRANGGTEYFLSIEDKKRQAVFAFCRLRLDKNGIYPAFIRELHTYGQLLGIGAHNKTASQHQGMGKKLMIAAEKICRKNKTKGLAVIAGVGVRDYYRRLGFALHHTYMVKWFK